ncbi:peptidoglycan-binding domain-containing protein [Bradyrhizobium liaoningense]
MALESAILAGNDRLEQAAKGPPSIKRRPPDDDADAVRRIQSALVALGFPLPKSFRSGPGAPPDGLFGDETWSAVKAFQQKAFPRTPAEWDGRVGKVTLAEMDRRLTGATKYLIVYKGLRTIPASVREFVKSRLIEVYKPFNVELDFSEARAPKDLLITFTSEMPAIPIYGESSRVETTTDGATRAGSGDGSIYVRALQVTRIELPNSNCEAAFLEKEDKLGAAIVYVTVHETAHMLGLNTGGFDDGGHSTDPANWMWDPGSRPGPSPPLFFDYTVQRSDTLGMIVMRYKQGTLTKCHVGPTDLTVQGVWNHPRNKNAGFIADPNKGKIPGRRANNPNFIYPGEKVALFNYNVKQPSFRGSVPLFVQNKSFTDEQQARMNRFISERRKIVK